MITFIFLPNCLEVQVRQHTARSFLNFSHKVCHTHKKRGQVISFRWCKLPQYIEVRRTGGKPLTESFILGYPWGLESLFHTGTLCSCTAVNTPGRVESVLLNVFWEMLALVPRVQTLPYLSRSTTVWVCLGLRAVPECWMFCAEVLGKRGVLDTLSVCLPYLWLIH